MLFCACIVALSANAPLMCPFSSFRNRDRYYGKICTPKKNETGREIFGTHNTKYYILTALNFSFRAAALLGSSGCIVRKNKRLKPKTRVLIIKSHIYIYTTKYVKYLSSIKYLYAVALVRMIGINYFSYY